MNYRPSHSVAFEEIFFRCDVKPTKKIVCVGFLGNFEPWFWAIILNLNFKFWSISWWLQNIDKISTENVKRINCHPEENLLIAHKLLYNRGKYQRDTVLITWIVRTFNRSIHLTKVIITPTGKHIISPNYIFRYN